MLQMQRVARGLAYRRKAMSKTGRIAQYDARVAAAEPGHLTAADAAMCELMSKWEELLEPRRTREAFRAALSGMVPPVRVAAIRSETARLETILLTTQLFVVLPR